MVITFGEDWTEERHKTRVHLNKFIFFLNYKFIILFMNSFCIELKDFVFSQHLPRVRK